MTIIIYNFLMIFPAWALMVSYFQSPTGNTNSCSVPCRFQNIAYYVLLEIGFGVVPNYLKTNGNQVLISQLLKLCV